MSSATLLVRPSLEFQGSFLEAVAEFQADGHALADTKLLDLEVVEKDFNAYLERRKAYEHPATLEPGYVLQSEFWLVSGQAFIGRSKLRHTLNDRLRQAGGHIGYEIRPLRRKQGYGTLILQLTLREARRIGLEQVLVTCDVENLGSRLVIEANGGVLEGEFSLPWPSQPIRRYWIDCEQRSGDRGDILSGNVSH